MGHPDMEILEVASADVLGEGPWWDAESQRLHWVDIKGRRIRTATLDGQEETPVETPEDVGFAVPAEDGSWVVGLRSGLHRPTPLGGWEPLWVADYDVGTHRINDGKTDARGRLWFGTMHDAETEASSAFYRWRPSRGAERVLGAITTSNGLGWSPDGRTLYYTDSMTHSIEAFDVEEETGALSGRRLFATNPAHYIPDGLTVDLDGCVWSAKWDGGLVVRYDPDGRVIEEIAVPVSRPTSVAFVGADLRTLAVTTASLDRGPGEPLAGSVLLLPTRTQGRPEARVACGDGRV